MTKRLAMMCLMTMLLIGVSSLSVAPSPQAMSNTLGGEAKIFLNYAQEFQNMATAYKENDLEFQIADGLRETASDEIDRLDGANTLLVVYGGTSCQSDRTMFRALVMYQLSSASRFTDLEIKATQNNLTHTKMPGMAALAVRMNDELRDAKEKLDQARNNLK